MRIFLIREYRLLGVLMIVYNKLQTFLLRILLFICHSSVCFPIFSQCPEPALPTLAFVRLGKQARRNPAHRNSDLPEPLCGYFTAGDGMREVFGESHREKHGFKSDHYQIES